MPSAPRWLISLLARRAVALAAQLERGDDPDPSTVYPLAGRLAEIEELIAHLQRGDVAWETAAVEPDEPVWVEVVAETRPVV